MFNDELLTLYPSVNISPSLTQNSRGFMTLHMISVELDSRGGPRMSEGGRAKMDKEGGGGSYAIWSQSEIKYYLLLLVTYLGPEIKWASETLFPAFEWFLK